MAHRPQQLLTVQLLLEEHVLRPGLQSLFADLQILQRREHDDWSLGADAPQPGHRIMPRGVGQVPIRQNDVEAVLAEQDQRFLQRRRANPGVPRDPVARHALQTPGVPYATHQHHAFEARWRMADTFQLGAAGRDRVESPFHHGANLLTVRVRPGACLDSAGVARVTFDKPSAPALFTEFFSTPRLDQRR
jgi:hypothetical protein